MNREIKFRAWQDNQMLTSPISSNYGLTRFFGFLYEDTPIMQYTGLKDKNGVEIYDRDVLKIKWQKDSIGGYLQSSDSYIEKEEIVVVEWMNIGWGFKKSDGKYLSLPKNCNIEKIGNVFENPEHLK